MSIGERIEIKRMGKVERTFVCLAKPGRLIVNVLKYFKVRF
jgi:hypothetical protein